MTFFTRFIVKMKSCNFLIASSLEYFVNAALQSHTRAPLSIVTVAYLEAMLLSSSVVNTSLLAIFKKKKDLGKSLCVLRLKTILG